MILVEEATCKILRAFCNDRDETVRSSARSVCRKTCGAC